MEQSDIKEVISILKSAKKMEDWDSIDDAIEYLQDFIEENLNESDE